MGLNLRRVRLLLSQPLKMPPSNIDIMTKKISAKKIKTNDGIVVPVKRCQRGMAGGEAVFTKAPQELAYNSEKIAARYH